MGKGGGGVAHLPPPPQTPSHTQQHKNNRVHVIDGMHVEVKKLVVASSEIEPSNQQAGG